MADPLDTIKKREIPTAMKIRAAFKHPWNNIPLLIISYFVILGLLQSISIFFDSRISLSQPVILMVYFLVIAMYVTLISLASGRPGEGINEFVDNFVTGIMTPSFMFVLALLLALIIWTGMNSEIIPTYLTLFKP